jgi:hypothetical protein
MKEFGTGTPNWVVPWYSFFIFFGRQIEQNSIATEIWYKPGPRAEPRVGGTHSTPVISGHLRFRCSGSDVARKWMKKADSDEKWMEYRARVPMRVRVSSGNSAGGGPGHI